VPHSAHRRNPIHIHGRRPAPRPCEAAHSGLRPTPDGLEAVPRNRLATSLYVQNCTMTSRTEPRAIALPLSQCARK
jgi:hypothetical protein